MLNLQNKLLLATNNAHKIYEMTQLLVPLRGIELVTPKMLGLNLDPEETGTTYLENAVIKARAFAAASGLATLADDSGLEVDALNGAPGIYSSRFGGVKGTAQHAYLLDQIAAVPAEKRTARFRCVIALVLPDDTLHSAEGVCEGRIGFEAIGENGFGYDPLFILSDRPLTMAQLTDEQKNRISHRAHAVHAAMPILREIFSGHNLNPV